LYLVRISEVVKLHDSLIQQFNDTLAATLDVVNKLRSWFKKLPSNLIILGKPEKWEQEFCWGLSGHLKYDKKCPAC
jgi:hypothetical protein